MQLKEKYIKEIVPSLKKKLGKNNIMEIPKLEKVVLNMGIGTYIRNGNKDFSSLKEHLSLIAGQAPIVIKSRKSISNFKLRAGMPVGMSVTLRGDKMYDFIDKLVNIVLPRVRDFRGVSKKGFDKQGNYNFGIKEHTIFLEVPQTDVVKTHGLQITVKTTANSKEEGRELLSELGFPFSK
ncbi:50S ribosomal protein L5 [Candidatus Gracilibacteria bacterium]|nr:MAG: 50S ribosomal protein L5 [Candidatus Gracilibacteria bacterium]PIE85741.1 MAG: 50S ribosomal protein L5 [Candidatus Gracilibacteria bacterium]